MLFFIIFCLENQRFGNINTLNIAAVLVNN